MWKYLTIFIALLCSLSIRAYDCKIDGIYYLLDHEKKMAAVTYKSIYSHENENAYKGEIIIPSQIENNGQRYDVVAIDFNAFKDCEKLRSVIIPNSVVRIGKEAFCNCKRLSHVMLPKSLTEIEEGVFMHSPSLVEIELPEGIQSIGKNAFAWCIKLKHIKFPASVKSIGYMAFDHCFDLSYVELPASLNKVDLDAFSECKAIQKIRLPKKLELVADNIFDTKPRYVFSDSQEVIRASREKKSDVDADIPSAKQKNGNTFALVIANEDYKRAPSVPYARNDGRIFAEYMRTTLGIPSDNVILLENATINDIKFGINKLSGICEAFKGNASLVVYYSGHGLQDDASRESYILPVDGYAENLSTGYSLKDLYRNLGEIKSLQTTVMLDASFSGIMRDGKMMVESRGVRLAPKKAVPSGNVVVMAASSDNEASLYCDEQCHGYFTYFILKKLKETSGNISLGELAEYVEKNVKVSSAINSGVIQNPTIISSPEMTDWKKLKLTESK